MMNEVKLNNILTKPVCIGTGLVALDVIIGHNSINQSLFLTGGSCGNVLTILSYLGWNTFPIARLSKNVASELLIEDLASWDVSSELLSITEDGSTPIIIHRILRDKLGLAKHRFEFRNPEDGKYLPSYKPCLASSVKDVLDKRPKSDVFFFDRINRGSIELSKGYKKNGSIVFFEPSSSKEVVKFNECLEIADIVKFAQDRIPNTSDFPLLEQVPLVIQTLGNEGLKFKRSGDQDWTFLKGFENDDVIDAAGAGDWCTAGIIKKLFSENSTLENISREQIIESLEFGQVLSSLNCSYEGARGLMYAVKNNELLLYIEHIFSLSSHQIPSKRRKPEMIIHQNQNLDISSLFASI